MLDIYYSSCAAVASAHNEGYHGDYSEVHQEVRKVKDDTDSTVLTQMFKKMFHMISFLRH